MDLTGKVAVVTGAASGIGLAIAEKCVSEQMKVVLADVEEDALELAADRLAQRGTVLAVPTDVSVAESVDELRRQADAFGPVHLLCNNAGVAGAGPGAAWEKPLSAWQWVLEVNLWGVIHGLRAFLPAMVERDQGHIVNTASIAGLISMPFGAPYAASKHAVVGISMSVYHELALRGSHVHLSVLCPGWIRTRIVDSERNWPDRFGSVPERDTNQMTQMFEAMVKQLVDTGMDPAMVAEQVLDAVRAERFWVLSNADDYGPLIRDVAASAVDGRNPPMARPT
ncbi:MAG TPA: SDR family NAD(P)-dependent oxidoreductase [Candidatus Dormibacteraeota bacterium]|nr:SDR family NAD(P)-dependent oxidoreductase [Candidatus Dormibacteraeota bacterium]